MHSICPAARQRRPRSLASVILAFTLLAAIALPGSAKAQTTAAWAGIVAFANLPDAQLAQDAPKIGAQSTAQSAAQNPPGDPVAPLRSSIHGVVEDHDGTVYQGVHITLVESASPEAPPQRATSDSSGRFEFPSVAPGPFQLTFDLQGFTTQVVPGVLLPGQSYELPPTFLPLATETSEVSVSASREEVAEAQLKDEMQQRVLGVVPNFYVVYAPNAAPLTTHQKFRLAWRYSIDPVTFLATGFFSGIEQADDQFKGYGLGAEGYAKRFGANYADGFIGTMIGSAILPSLFKQDPRYFYKGTGTVKSRILYAIANSVICKGDNGRWQTNYSGILGSLAAGGISNIYYPASDRNGAGLTFENALIGIGGSAGQNLVQEFLVKHLTPKLPNYNPSKP